MFLCYASVVSFCMCSTNLRISYYVNLTSVLALKSLKARKASVLGEKGFYKRGVCKWFSDRSSDCHLVFLLNFQATAGLNHACLQSSRQRPWITD